MNNFVRVSIAALGIAGTMATGIGFADPAQASADCQTVQWVFGHRTTHDLRHPAWPGRRMDASSHGVAIR
jgi:hypothetical protein